MSTSISEQWQQKIEALYLQIQRAKKRKQGTRLTAEQVALLLTQLSDRINCD